MATLTINGRQVTVDDSFLKLSPEQQEATVDEIAASMGNAPQKLTTKQEYDQLPWYQQIPQAADDIVRATANGLTFGFADKLAGYMGGEGTAAERAKSADARERAGLAYDAAQLAGGVRTALSAGNAGLTLLGAGGTAGMTGAGGLAARTGLAGLEGAGYGVLDALGNDTSVTEGALLGAAFGGGLNIAGEGINAVTRAFRSPQTRANEYVSNAAQRDALTPEIASARLSELGEGAMLADISPNLRAQGSAIATTPGSGQTAVRDALIERSAGATPRITDAVDSAMGGNQNVLSLADDIVARRSDAAKPLYDVSRSVPVSISDDVAKVLERPSAQKAISDAQRNVLDRGGVFDLNNPTVGVLDEIKKSLDDMITPAVRSGESGRASSLMDIKNSIVNIADKASPEYAQARQVFSDATAVKNALDDGAKAFNNNLSPDALQRYISGLDESAREAYISGARQKVADVMGTARNDAQSARALFNKGYNAEKARILLGDDAANQLLSAIKSEDAFQATKNAIIGGSDTAAKLNAQDLIAANRNNAGVLRSAANMNFGDAAVSAVDSILGGISAGRNEKINNEIAKILIGNNPAAIAPSVSSKLVSDDLIRALLGGYAGVQ